MLTDIPPGTVRPLYRLDDTQSFEFTTDKVASFNGKIDAADINVVASIGNETITTEEFKEIIRHIRTEGNTQQVLETMTPEGRRRLLDRLIEQKLFALEAERQGLPQDPIIQMAIQAAVEKVLARYFLQKRLFALDLDDDQLKQYYRKNRQNFQTENRVKARHIVTRTKREAEEALNRSKDLEKAVTAITRLLFFKKDLLVISVFIVSPSVWRSFLQPS